MDPVHPLDGEIPLHELLSGLDHELVEVGLVINEGQLAEALRRQNAALRYILRAIDRASRTFI